MKNIKLAFFLMGPGLLASSCHDDLPFSSDSEVIEKEGHTITSFSLEAAHFNIPENVDSVRVSLIGSSGTSKCFGAGVEHTEGFTRFKMVIPDSSELPDGSYIVTMRRPDGSSIPGRLSSEFKSRMLSSVSIIIPKYTLDGSGTQEDPYLIKDDNDFSMFLINLADDEESFGAGLVFQQTSDVTAPNQSSLIPGRGYWGAPFAGIYNGDNHTIRNLYYRGSGREDADSGIGLFNRLLGTAYVENLSLTGAAMSGICKEAGLIAGQSLGEVSLSNISVAGFISGGSEIGGLVGSVKSGSLFIDKVDMELAVNGTDNIGGIAGLVENDCSLYVSNVTTPSSLFTISGTTNVGGILGSSHGILSATDITVDHKVSSEDSDINIIEATSQNVGGIVGSIATDAGNQSFIRCRVLCPVGGENASYIGGLAGITTQSSELLINDFRMCSILEGNNYIGGVFGKADLSNSVSGLKIIGPDLSVRIEADDADAKIKGKEYTGGFAGWWKGSISFDSKVKINLPIQGEKFTGGGFGAIYDTKLDASKFIFGQSDSNVGTTMRVNGKNETGGFVGHLEKSTLKGGSDFDFNEGSGIRVPDPKTRFKPLFAGVVKGDRRTGGLIGYAINSKILALCSGANVTGNETVGGIAGYCAAADKSYYIEDCTFTGEIKCPDAPYVGGIVGQYYAEKTGLIHDCINYGNIKGGDSAGGILGTLTKEYPYGLKTTNERLFELKWCVNLGEISGVRYIGGIIGKHDNNDYNYIGNENDFLNSSAADIVISYCMNGGEITGTGGDGSNVGGYNDKSGAGGIIGGTGCYAGIMNCANHANVFGVGRFHGVGGVAGKAGEDAAMTGARDRFRNIDVKECMNSGNVSSGNPDSYVGGVIGYQEEGNKSDVRDCHNLGAVPCKLHHNSGGIVGTVDHLSNIYSCVNQGMVSHGNATIGTHKTGSLFDHDYLYFLEGTGENWPSATKVSKADFSKQTSFKGLDFNNSWIMTATGPELRDCPWKNPELTKVKN